MLQVAAILSIQTNVILHCACLWLAANLSVLNGFGGGAEVFINIEHDECLGTAPDT
jgi:hypothetical protein